MGEKVLIEKPDLLGLDVETFEKFMDSVIFDVQQDTGTKLELTEEGYIKITKKDKIYKPTKEELAELEMVIRLGDALSLLQTKPDGQSKESNS